MWGGAPIQSVPFRESDGHPVKSRPTTPPNALMRTVESCVDQSVASCWPAQWKENFITELLLRNLVEKLPANRYHFAGPGGSAIQVSFAAYKVEGAAEREYGDISILVRYNTEHTLGVWSGIGYVEAKRTYVNGTLQGLKGWDKLATMVENAPYHYTVIYDHSEPARLDAKGLRPSLFDWSGNKHGSLSSRAMAIPTHCMLAMRIADRTVYQYCMPFSYLLCSRFLRGYDLIFGNIPSLTEKYLNRIGGAQYVLVCELSAKGTAAHSSPRPLLLDPRSFTPLGGGGLTKSDDEVAIADDAVGSDGLDESPPATMQTEAE